MLARISALALAFFLGVAFQFSLSTLATKPQTAEPIRLDQVDFFPHPIATPTAEGLSEIQYTNPLSPSRRITIAVRNSTTSAGNPRLSIYREQIADGSQWVDHGRTIRRYTDGTVETKQFSFGKETLADLSIAR